MIEEDLLYIEHRIIVVTSGASLCESVICIDDLALIEQTNTKEYEAC